jgi:hypothetical protein
MRRRASAGNVGTGETDRHSTSAAEEANRHSTSAAGGRRYSVPWFTSAGGLSLHLSIDTRHLAGIETAEIVARRPQHRG